MYAKSFPSHKAHGVALISVSLTLSQTPAYTGGLVHHAVCWFTPELSLVFIASTHRVPVVITNLPVMVTHLTTNPAWCWLTLLMLTKPNRQLLFTQCFHQIFSYYCYCYEIVQTVQSLILTYGQYSDRCFAAAGFQLCNSLLVHLRQTDINLNCLNCC